MSAASVTLATGGLVLASASLAPIDFFTAVVALYVVIFACGWGRLVHAPAPGISGAVILIVAVASGAAVRLSMDAAWSGIVVAFVIAAAFFGEIVRGEERSSVLGSIATTATGSLIGVAASAWIALENYRVWLILAYPMGLCLGVAGLCLLLRGPMWVKTTGSIVACTLAGLGAVAVVMATRLGAEDSVLVASASVGASEPLFAMLTVFAGFGCVCGLLIAACHAFFSGRVAPTTPLAALALGVIPILVMSLPVYAFARLVSS